MPMISFLEYYFQWHTLRNKITVKNYSLQTNIKIREGQEHITVPCGCRSKNVSYDCNFISGVVAEFCNDDFLEKKKAKVKQPTFKRDIYKWIVNKIRRSIK